MLRYVTLRCKQASLFAQLINIHYNIDDSNAQGQAAMKAHAQHCWPPCKKINKKTNKHVHSAGIQID